MYRPSVIELGCIFHSRYLHVVLLQYSSINSSGFVKICIQCVVKTEREMERGKVKSEWERSSEKERKYSKMYFAIGTRYHVLLLYFIFLYFPILTHPSITPILYLSLFPSILIQPSITPLLNIPLLPWPLYLSIHLFLFYLYLLLLPDIQTRPVGPLFIAALEQ